MKTLRGVISYELRQRARFILSGEGFENGNGVRILSTTGSGTIEWTVHQPTTAQSNGKRLMFFATPNRAETKKTESDMTSGDVLGDLNVTVTFADGTSSQTMSISNVAFLSP